MDVSNVNAYGQTAYELKANGYEAKAEAAEKKDETAATAAAADEAAADEDKAAVYESSSSGKTKTYKTDHETINRLKQDLEYRQAQLKSLVLDMLKKQGKTAQDAIGGVPFEIDAMTQEEAQAAIAEDGFWGVEQTSQRLVDFAKALTGGDPALVEKMRDAIKKGFGQAEEAWGGKMPGITQDTYDATMKKLDEWAAEGQAASTQTSEDE